MPTPKVRLWILQQQSFCQSRRLAGEGCKCDPLAPTPRTADGAKTASAAAGDSMCEILSQGRSRGSQMPLWNLVPNGKAQESQMEATTKPQNSAETEVGAWGTKNESKKFTQNQTSYQNSTTKEKSNAKRNSDENQQSRHRFTPSEISVVQQSDKDFQRLS